MGKFAVLCVIFVVIGLRVADFAGKSVDDHRICRRWRTAGRTVDGVALACPGGANANACPVATLDWLRSVSALRKKQH